MGGFGFFVEFGVGLGFGVWKLAAFGFVRLRVKR